MLLLELGTYYLVTMRNSVKPAIIEQYGYPYSHWHAYLQCVYGAVSRNHTAFNELIPLLPILYPSWNPDALPPQPADHCSAQSGSYPTQVWDFRQVNT